MKLNSSGHQTHALPGGLRQGYAPVSYTHLRGLDVVELTQLGAALLALAVLVADTLVIGHGVLGEMVKVVLRGLDILLNRTDLVVGLVAVVTREADELQFRQALHVGERDLATQPFPPI